MEKEFIEKMYIEFNDRYAEFKKQKLDLALKGLNVLEILNPDYKETPLVDELAAKNIFVYCKAIYSYSFISNYKKSKRIYTFDLSSLDKVFTKIEKDERVLFFNKYTVIAMIDMYYDLRITLDLLNRLCASTFERGAEGNWVHASLKEAMHFENESNSDKRFQKQLDFMARSAFFTPLKEYLNTLIKTISDQLETDTKEIEKEMAYLISGDLRVIEKNYFPLFYNYLFLKKDYEVETLNLNKLSGPSPTKKDILYDIFPIIMPLREFETETTLKNNEALSGGNYDGSFYKYKINTVKSIIGT